MYNIILINICVQPNVYTVYQRRENYQLQFRSWPKELWMRLKKHSQMRCELKLKSSTELKTSGKIVGGYLYTHLKGSRSNDLTLPKSVNTTGHPQTDLNALTWMRFPHFGFNLTVVSLQSTSTLCASLISTPGSVYMLQIKFVSVGVLSFCISWYLLYSTFSLCLCLGLACAKIDPDIFWHLWSISSAKSLFENSV